MVLIGDQKSHRMRSRQMSLVPFESLPEVLKRVETRPLFVMNLTVTGPVDVGETPGANRRVGIVTGGLFAGERLCGEVVDGVDWQAVRPDGSTTLDVRLLLKIKEGGYLTMAYRGVRWGPPEVLAQLGRGEVVDPASLYFRINPMFETADGPHAWLNRVLAVGIGQRLTDSATYSVFEVL
jgi:hypothetical protein